MLASEESRSSAAVLPCKDKKSTPAKKLVQARLPFKRLNPVPKEKADGVLDVKKVKTLENASSQKDLPNLDTSMENVENDRQLDPEIASVPPKTLNGKGPLDQFLKRFKAIPAPPSITIDLTEDSNSAHTGDHECSKETSANVQKEAAKRTVQHATVQSKPVGSSQIDQSDVPMETDAVLAKMEASTNADCKDERKPCFPKAVSKYKGFNGSRVKQDVIFEGKMPMVVLEDIRFAKPSIVVSWEESLVSVAEDEEEVESSPEVESISPASSPSAVSSPAASSPLAGSSSDAGSSPGAQSALDNRSGTSPSSLSTPIRKIPLKSSKPSSEKRRKEQDERKKKLQAEKEERDRLKEEAKNARERAKEEAKKKKDEEKELKDKERKEKRDKEEQEKKEKREKEEKDKAEKLRLKEEKRKEKQDALEAKLEEKRKKEEEKRVKEEEKRIKAGKSEITRFFQKPKTQQAPKTFASSCGKFAPFEIKKNMALAPLCRVDFDQAASEKLDEMLLTQMSEVSFLKELKCRKPRKCRRTIIHRHIDPANSDVIAVENGETDDVQDMPDDPLISDLIVADSGATDVPERKQFGRMKLLQFSENHRPAYWGTWNKQSGLIHPRKPWLKDEKILDYEVDSDEEWEEEEPGESLSHSEGDDDDEPAGEDDEDDDGFFVPHGYLSEDEGAAEEECTDPENQKVRQKLKAKEWDELVSEGKKFRVLKPLVIGCIWESSEVSRELKALQRFAACILESVMAEEELAQEKSVKRNTKDQQILAKLLPLLHGNFNASKVIIQEFQECCRRGLLNEGPGLVYPESNGSSPKSPNTSRPQTPTVDGNTAIPSKARLKRIISENSTYEKRPEVRMCWYVHAEVLKKFDQEGLPVPCQWTYLTHVNSAVREDSSNSTVTGSTLTTPVSVKRKSTGSMSITKFMKRPKEVKQVGTAETDGFQADTEDDEDDDDCIVVDVQPGKGVTVSTKIATVVMETVPNEGSMVRIANPASLAMSERGSATITSKSAVVSNKSEVKTVLRGKAMVCVESAMETDPSGGAVFRVKSEKTVPSGDAVVLIESAMEISPSGGARDGLESAMETVPSGVHAVGTESKMEIVPSEAAGVSIEGAIKTASSAGAVVITKSPMETIPIAGARISIPNQA